MIRISDIEQVYQSCRREYMSGVDRSKREYKTQEVFTPDWMVEYCLEEIQEYRFPGAICLDQAAGDGQFLSRILIEKILYRQSIGMDIHDSFVFSLDEIFGVDIEPENVILCRQRLLCGCTDSSVTELVNRRILIGNCLDPYEEISGQTPQDKNLMIKYFGSKSGKYLHDLKKISNLS